MSYYRILQLANRSVGRMLFWLAQPIFAVRSKKPRTRVFLYAHQQCMVLLVRNYIGDGKWDLPGGGTFRGEEYTDAACREVHEETGIKINKDSLEYVGSARYRPRWYYAPLSVRLYRHEVTRMKETKPRSLEIEAVQWFSIDNLPNCSEIVHHAVERRKNNA